MPTAIASDSARQRWTRARLCSPEIQGESPGAVEVRPSSDIASFRVTSGRPVRACLRKGWLSSRAAAASAPAAKLDLHPAVAEDPGPAPGRLLARDPQRRSPPGQSRPRAPPPHRAAAAPGAHRAPASRTSSPRPDPPPARDSPPAPPAPHAARRARRETPRQRPRHPARHRPTSGFGLTRPRPSSANSSARRRCSRSVAVSWEFIDRLTSQSAGSATAPSRGWRRVGVCRAELRARQPRGTVPPRQDPRARPTAPRNTLIAAA